MANELFGAVNTDAEHAAIAIELFHNFTLIHDDIMDEAPLRRGKQTLHIRNGLTAGILCGDVMSIYAYQSIGKIKNNLPEALALFNKTAIEVCEGQQMDMDFEQREEVSLEEYIEMISLKTAVLLACSLKMGAILGGATAHNADKLYAFGKNLGIAFQLKDDYLDAFGNGEKTGKQIGGDILANKKTYLALYAHQKSDDTQRQALHTVFSKTDKEKIDTTLAIYKATHADKTCLQAIQSYSQLAYDHLDKVALPSSRKEALKELAHYLLNRES